MSRCLTDRCPNEARYQSGRCGVHDCLYGPSERLGIPTQHHQEKAGKIAAETLDVLHDVHMERKRQHAKWGEQNWPDFTTNHSHPGWTSLARDMRDFNNRCWTHAWSELLYEEVAEAFAESDPVKLRAELVQVAALAVQWCEVIDRRVRR